MMNGSLPLPTLSILKEQAKQLRSSLATDGIAINHARSLELIAHNHGYKDWNTLHSATGNAPRAVPAQVGQRVSGTYLGQPFEAEVLKLQKLNVSGNYRITLHLDEPVDVVTFDSFSSFRQRISCTIETNGKTSEKTSNGMPQLSLSL